MHPGERTAISPSPSFRETRPDKTYLRGLKYPDNVFAYKPPKREGLPASSRQTRKWIGMFEHWQPKANPLSTLGPACYILTAAEIFDATGSLPWLRERLPSVEAAAKYLLSRKTPNGLIGGSGFYVEVPPRYAWDGVTQCYVIHAFRELARLFHMAGNKATGAAWSARADELARTFVTAFWRQDHFGEYIHPERGLVDSHGLSDVNWAAVAFGVAAGRNLELLWPRLLNEPGFWCGGMPTQLVSKPFTYQKWEYNEPLPFAVGNPLNDVAAMGRVWYLEATACKRMRANERLVESVRKVCRAGLKAGGYWRERYHPQPNGTVVPAGAQKYCEYAAILTRVVFGNRKVSLWTQAQDITDNGNNEPGCPGRPTFRLSGEHGNSGIYFRTRRGPDFDAFGPQADIDQNGKNTVTPLGDPAELLKHYKNGGWNDYRVVVRGPEITLEINGVLMCQVTDKQKPAARDGLLALQMHEGPPMKVQFKNIRIKKL